MATPRNIQIIRIDLNANTIVVTTQDDNSEIAGYFEESILLSELGNSVRQMINVNINPVAIAFDANEIILSVPAPPPM